MTSTATAHQQLAQIQDLVERFAILFPSWPSLSEARGAITKAKRDLDKLDAGQNPYGEGNRDPAGTAINRPYSFLHFMATTATATDSMQLVDPMTGASLKISAPTRPDGSAAGVQETIDSYAAQISAVERYRGSAPAPTPTPTATPTIAAAPPYAPQISATSSPAPASSPSSSPSSPSWSPAAEGGTAYSYGTPSLVNSLGPGGAGAAEAAAGPSSSSAAGGGGGKAGLIIAAAAVAGVVLLMGKKKGGRR